MEQKTLKEIAMIAKRKKMSIDEFITLAVESGYSEMQALVAGGTYLARNKS